MSRFRDRSYSGTRIDGRVQNDPATAVGMRGIHRDMRGNVIGGYSAEGVPMGVKRRGGEPMRTGPAASPAPGGMMAPVVAGLAAEAAPAATEPNALGGGLSRWHAMNPNAMSAAERLNKENPGMRNPALPVPAVAAAPAAAPTGPVTASSPDYKQRFMEAASVKQPAAVPSPVIPDDLAAKRKALSQRRTA